MRTDQKTKKESVTFRVDEYDLQRLSREAEQNSTSLNTLVNQIFKKHLSWHSNATKAGFITVRRAMLVRMME